MFLIIHALRKRLFIYNIFRHNLQNEYDANYPNMPFKLKYCYKYII